jgi:hypothetical protein
MGRAPRHRRRDHRRDRALACHHVRVAAKLATEYTRARTALGDSARTDVDVLITDDIPVQRLVDILAALDAAGATSVGIGRAPKPDSPDAQRRGKRIVRTTIGQPQAAGDLDKAIIRRYVKREIPRITACYEKALVANPDLAGTVQTQFFISPNGAVATADATGMDPDVAACVADIIKSIEFPKPKGGGGVQVNYPFSFRN